MFGLEHLLCVRRNLVLSSEIHFVTFLTKFHQTQSREGLDKSETVFVDLNEYFGRKNSKNGDLKNLRSFAGELISNGGSMHFVVQLEARVHIDLEGGRKRTLLCFL